MTAEVQTHGLAADRGNTVKADASALRQFETVRNGLLPAT